MNPAPAKIEVTLTQLGEVGDDWAAKPGSGGITPANGAMDIPEIGRPRPPSTAKAEDGSEINTINATITFASMSLVFMFLPSLTS